MIKTKDSENDLHKDPEVESKLLVVDASLPEEKTLSKDKKVNGLKKKEKSEYDRTLTDDINKFLADEPLTDETTCGFWIFKGSFLQRFANQTAYVIIYGIVGCVFSMTNSYFNGTITTMEKRFKISSKSTGTIIIGHDISQMLLSAFISYYAGKGHRPRWIGFGVLTLVGYCFVSALPHFLYGPGEETLALTSEFGVTVNLNTSSEAFEDEKTKSLCRENVDSKCKESEGNLGVQIILFVGQFLSGIGFTIYASLGISYMDDNTKRTKTPVLLSLSYFLRMLGPAVGYALASFCLRLFIEPQLTPLITESDPRWLGAWWMGWLVMGGMLMCSGVFLAMFPRRLPRAVARRLVEDRRNKNLLLDIKEKRELVKNLLDESKFKDDNLDVESKQPRASFNDMITTFKRLLKNKTLMLNNFSSIFYFLGYEPYLIFAPKYMEIEYRQSAATSNIVTGSVALVFSAVGVLSAGFVISRYKPKARLMAAWNVFVGFLTVLGILAYAFVGCPENEESVIVNIHDSSLSNKTTCNSACNCDFVPYSPVCGENNMTYISPCHAGCKKLQERDDGDQKYYDCACIPNSSQRLENMLRNSTNVSNFDIFDHHETPYGGVAVPGACPVDCFSQFVTFLAIMCLLKLIGASGRASNFLVSIRCVSEEDKDASLGISMMMMCMLAFIPGPVFIGWLLDSFCLVWGKTCTDQGNCWLYNPDTLRFSLSFISSTLIAISALFDCGVWYYVKDLKIFDENEKDVEMRLMQVD